MTLTNMVGVRCCFKLLYAIVVVILLHMNNPCIGCSEREWQALLALKQGLVGLSWGTEPKTKIAANGMQSTAATKLAMLLSLIFDSFICKVRLVLNSLSCSIWNYWTLVTIISVGAKFQISLDL
ncbi:receptor-like protein 12 [Prunus yedoensis var. nudiflora]|uniref:Receptor-like protein 12 n=1 Tax=Prunus yedoensis var. nudiflora TaxID=2094558 RepID=A0A314Y5L2_PRUYE|nr:receptor-like protein 12 [Prunus yedoensis var. nudiflora]